MSLHSYSKILIHLIWATLNREKLLNKESRIKLSEYFYSYSKEKNIPILINFVNSDHCHLLIDLPTSANIEEIVQMYKGSSSHWLNSQKLLEGKFSWGRGYGAFSVSESIKDRIYNYIKNQEEHHRVKTFSEEYSDFIRKYGLVEHSE